MVTVLKVQENKFFNTNAGNLRPTIQGIQKRGPEECIGNYSPCSLFVGAATGFGTTSVI